MIVRVIDLKIKESVRKSLVHNRVLVAQNYSHSLLCLLFHCSPLMISIMCIIVLLYFTVLFSVIIVDQFHAIKFIFP